MMSSDLLVALGSAATPGDWAELVARHGTRLWAVAHAAAGAGLAEDAFQEGLIAIRQGAGRFRPGADAEASAVAWMVTVVHRTAIDLVRRESRRKRHETPVGPTVEAMPMDSPAAHDAVGDVAPAVAAAMRALEQLPERHRQVIRLRLLAGLDVQQAASVIGCPATQVPVRLRRALTVLRRHCVPAGAEAGAAAPSLAVLESCLHHAAVPPAALPVGMHGVALAAFTKPAAAAAGWSLGAIMAIMSLGCGAVATLIFAVVMPMAMVPSHAAAQAGEAPGEAAPQASASAPAVFRVAAHDYAHIVVSLDFYGAKLDDIADFYNRILRIPLRIDPSVTSATRAETVTLVDDGNESAQSLAVFAQALHLGFRTDADGTEVIGAGPIPDIPAKADVDRTSRFDARDVTGAQFLATLYRTCGMPLPDPFPDLGADTVSFRGILQNPERQEDFLEALLPGYDFRRSPHRAWMARVLTVPAFAGSVDDGLALVARVGGIPCRRDPGSGPVPRIVLPAERITCETLLYHIAEATNLHISGAGDGMVMYRPQSRRFEDDSGSEDSPAGKPYRLDHAPWWFDRGRIAAKPVVTFPALIADLPISVNWRDMPLKAVVKDLQDRVHLPVMLEVPPALADQSILLVMDDRPLGDVLTCLSDACGCDCELFDGDTAILITSPGFDRSTFSATASAPAASATPGTPAKRSQDL